MKAKKGNPFERKVAYNLLCKGYKVERLDDNTKGIDLIIRNSDVNSDMIIKPTVIECKFHKKFSWNEVVKIYEKTKKTAEKYLPNSYPVVVFKSNQQPPLIMYTVTNYYIVQEFTAYFGCKFDNIPKGYKVWKEDKKE
jgi:hypothetical protein